MGSDGQRENDQAGDNGKNSSDEPPRQTKITFQDLFGVKSEEIKQISENFARVGDQLQKAFPPEHFRDIQKRQDRFARDVVQAQALLASALQELAHGANEAQRIGDVIAEGLLTLREDLEASLPPQNVLAAAFAQGYRQAQRSRPVVEDNEQALDFLVEMSSLAWEQLREKSYFLSEVNPPSEEDFVEAVVGAAILTIGYVAGPPSDMVAVMIYYLVIHPQIKDRYKP